MTTIFSLITGNFGGSVSVIRISGPKTIKCLENLGFKGIPQHQKASLQKVINSKIKLQ
jgi:tRNA U34 5-carboxymethylaminomethyl modifying GTPase MnmE/TrmE